MQRVEDGERVEQRHFDGPPRKQRHYPGQPEEEGEAGHPPQVLAEVAARARGPVQAHVAQLHQDHQEHGGVAQQHKEDVAHHRHIERHVILHPATEKDK